jgi:hypothetical protein
MAMVRAGGRSARGHRFASVLDVAAVDQQQETPGDAGNTEGEGGGSMAVIIGGAVGGVLLIALAAALFVKRSKTSSSNSSGAYEEKAIEAPGDRTKTHSIDVNENYANPMMQAE